MAGKRFYTNKTLVSTKEYFISQVERFGMPTWRRLAEAVEDDSGGNNPALAKKIMRDHSGG